MTDPDVRNLRKKIRNNKRRRSERILDITLEAYAIIQRAAFEEATRPEPEKTRSPIERLGRFLTKR